MNDYEKGVMEYFYKDLSGTNFKNITPEKLEEILKKSESLRNYFQDDKQRTAFNVNSKYIDIMIRMKKARNILNLKNNSEKFLFFIYVVDPTFEIFIQYGVANKIEDIKKFMLKKYGIYDPKIITIEKFLVKHFLSQKNKEQLEQEIERRVFS